MKLDVSAFGIDAMFWIVVALKKWAGQPDALVEALENCADTRLGGVDRALSPIGCQ